MGQDNRCVKKSLFFLLFTDNASKDFPQIVPTHHDEHLRSATGRRYFNVNDVKFFPDKLYFPLCTAELILTFGKPYQPRKDGVDRI